MTMEPIRERWRDLPAPGAAAGAEEGSPESVAGSLFRAAPSTRPRTPQAASSLLVDLREHGRLRGSGWLQRVFGMRRGMHRGMRWLAVALSMFFSLNLAMALVLPPVNQLWSRAWQVAVSEVSMPRRAGHGRARPAALPPSPIPAAPAVERAPDTLEPPEALALQAVPEAPPEAMAEAPALSSPRRHVYAPTASRETELAPPPPAPVAAAPVAPAPEPATDALAGEAELLSRALGDLGAGRPARALTELASYHERFPHGSLAYEATLAEVKAEMATGQDGRALAALEGALVMPGFGGLPRSNELILLRAELQARARDCARALVTFDMLVSAEDLDAPLAERALYGRASCLATQGDQAGSRQALQEYLRRFPAGRFAATARTALGTEE